MITNGGGFMSGALKMELSALPGFAPAPLVQPDTRPAADTVALARDATPDLPLPVPPVPSQQALIGQAALRGSEPDARARPDAPVTEAERTLKPYGIAMLPERASDDGAGSGQRDG